MGASFRWFKKVEIQEDHTLDFIDTDNTSHTYSNAKNICDLFEKYAGINIPYIESTFEYESKEDIGLIYPINMIGYCNTLLSKTNDDMIKRYYDSIQFIKDLSIKGYYVIYIM
ncbi:MAG: hypothetical protein NC131_13465 [Roseburia sp.]|nr:hypothetical protein [Roseburia sp.]